MKKQVLMIAVVCLAMACSDKPEKNPPVQPGNKGLLKMIQLENTFNVFRYDNVGRLVGITDSLKETTPALQTDIKYTAGKIQEIKYGYMTHKYEYPDDNTIVVRINSNTDPALDREVYTFANNKLIEKIRYYAPTDYPEVRILYKYDNEGNMIRQEIFAYDAGPDPKWINEATVEFSYDNKTGQNTNIENRNFFLMAKNAKFSDKNPSKIDWYDGRGHLLRSHVFRYDYDAIGRKTKRTEDIVVNGRIVSTEISFYTYQ